MNSGGASNGGGFNLQNLIDILGEYFIDSQGRKIPVNTFYHVDKFIGIYFSCSWAPPCIEFNPMLIDFYQKVNSQGKKIEIIYVNSDEDMYSYN